jgi:chromosome segregation ATPase
MTDKHDKSDWPDWDRWCDARIDRKRSFDRAVLVELVAELKAVIEDQDEKLKEQTENIRGLETKLAELRAASDLRSAEDHHASVKLAEHQIAIAELRHLVKAEQAKVIDLPDVPQRRGLN